MKVDASPPEPWPVAHHPRWHQRLVARLAHAFVVANAATQRFFLRDPDAALDLVRREPVIFAIWHNRLAFAPIIHARYGAAVCPGRKLAALASASRDGALAARFLELCGVQPIRGSSSRRGLQALAELAEAAQRGCDLAITPDGPRGPRYQVHAGAISLAQLTHRSLVPTCWNTRWRLDLRSWDRFQIPLPFGRCEVTFGAPLQIERGIDDDTRQQLRGELERRLRAITAD